MALTKVSGSVLKDPLSLGGEVSIGGTLTYQDVTNVDAIGIITARAGVNVSAGEIVVGSNIKIGNAGIITASGLDISGDIDVDGHTNLDNVSVSGVLTATSYVGGLPITNGANNRVITATGTNTLGCDANFSFDGNLMQLGQSGAGGALYIHGDTINNPGGRDAKVWIEDPSSNDWALHINKPSHNYGIQMSLADSASHAFYIIGGGGERFRITAAGEVIVREKITHLNDSDTQIKFPAANTISFDTNGTERLRIDSSGQVKIQSGTVIHFTNTNNDITTDTSDGSDNKRITIAAGGTTDSSRGANINLTGNEYSGANGKLELSAGNSGNSNGSIDCYTGGSQRLSIKSDGVLLLPTTGKLSVGTTNPVARFQVGPANGSRQIEIEEYGVIRGYNRNSNAWAQIDFEASSYSFDCGGTERVHIDSNGVVTGIWKTGADDKRKFDNNDDFNESNGRFTAPVDGVYQISVAWDELHSSATIIDVQINGGGGALDLYSTEQRTAGTGWNSWFTSSIAKLASGDYVTINLRNTSGTYPFHQNNGRWGHYSIYLIG